MSNLAPTRDGMLASNDSFHVGASVLQSVRVDRGRQRNPRGKTERCGVLSDLLGLEDLLSVERQDGVRVRLARSIGSSQFPTVDDLDLQDAHVVGRLSRADDDVNRDQPGGQEDRALASRAVWSKQSELLGAIQALLDQKSGVHPDLGDDILLQTRQVGQSSDEGKDRRRNNAAPSPLHRSR